MMRRAIAAFLLVSTFQARLALADPPQQGPTLVPYTVLPGERCDTIAKKLFGNPQRYDILHKYNPGLGPTPHHLKEGTVLMVPAPTPDAHLSAVRNKVEVETPTRRPGKPNDPLYRNDRVSTAAASSAELTFRDDTLLAMEADTLVVILGSTRTHVEQTTDAMLLNGDLRARLSEFAGKTPRPLELETDGARVALGLGDARVSVDLEKATRLAVYRGMSGLSAERKTVSVSQGFGSKAEKGKAPTPPALLPAAPAWVAAPRRLTLVHGAAADVTGEYGPGGGQGPPAARWHVQLARDTEFRDLIIDARVPVGVRRLEARHLASGAYFARVSAIDADRFEGPFGASTSIEVATLTSTPSDGYRATLEVAPAGLYCAVDDAPLAPYAVPLQIGTTRPRRVRCALTETGAEVAEVIHTAAYLGVTVSRVTLARGGRAVDTGGVPIELHDARRALLARPEAAMSAADGVLQAEVTHPATHIHVVGAGVDPARRNNAAGELTFELRDAHGTPLSDVGLALSAAGVTLGDPRATPTPGLFTVPIRWRSGLGATTLRVRVNGAEQADSPPVLLDPPAPAERDPGSPRLELAVMGGASLVGAGLTDAGMTVAGSLGIGFPFDKVELSAAVRAGYERHEIGVEGGMAAEDALLAGLALSVRLRSARSSFRPYATIMPQVVQALVHDGSRRIAEATLAGASVGLGIERRLGPGALFLEGGYRLLMTERQASAALNLNGIVGALGYQLSL